MTATVYGRLLFQHAVSTARPLANGADMANYYDQSSFVVEFDTPENREAASAAIQPLLDVLNRNDWGHDDHQDEYDWPGTLGGMSAFCEPDISEEGRHFWFQSDESIDAWTVGNIVMLLLQQDGAPDDVYFTWASMCSKARPGGFGGGCCYVTAEGVEIAHTDTMRDYMKARAASESSVTQRGLQF